MTKITKALLAEIVSAIVERVSPDMIIVFGSQASGRARPDSDIDLLVVERKPFGLGRSRRAEMARIRAALSRFRIAKDILVCSEDEVAKWRDSANHIIAHCFREGKVLYERS